VTGRYSNQLNYHSALSSAQVLAKAGIIPETVNIFPAPAVKILCGCA
jgi:hypothetical protein